MHRELSHADQQFRPESRAFLYVFTAVVGLLLGADLLFRTDTWPAFAEWSADNGVPLPKDNLLFGLPLALYAALLGGARALYGALDSLLQGRLGADLALAVACIAAIYFEKYDVAAEIVFIGLLGECLEHFTFGRTQRALRTIVEICPRRCWRLRDGREERVLASELQVGDHVVVKPGARVPADGVVLEGRSAVDVSALTGESVPVDKGPGDEVLAGSLNQFGALTVEAKRVAEQTVVGRVIELTARALQDKAPLERTADRLARYFLPVVLGLAFVTFAAGFVVYGRAYLRSPTGGNFKADVLRPAGNPALAVLVVACPCALILATPAAVIAAIGRLAGTGVLLKRGAALERLAAVRAFAFDKTGTLTEGKLELGDVVVVPGVTREELLRTAATAEQKSEHLLAKLIVHEAARLNLTPDAVIDFQAHPGSGVAARTGTATILVGNPRLLAEQDVVLLSDVLAEVENLGARGQTVLLVARNGQVLGAIGARDRVRPEAVEVLAQLRSAGIADIALLTGDREAAAREVAAALGLTEVHAELLPADKAAFIEKWQKQHPVAMVGDGINDAPALARADVGVAIGGSGTDVAAEAGDVVFMGDPLRHLPLLLRLSRQTVSIIKQNIVVFAFGVNIAGILLVWLWQLLAPSAEWADKGPVVGVVYHQVGSLLVLLNSMRLLWFERTTTGPTMQRVRRRWEGVNNWLEHRFDFDEALHTASHHRGKIVAGAVVLLVLLWALSGFTQINADEIGIVRRFGRALPQDLEPGLTWRWPWPIESVTRVKPRRIQTVEVGFRSTGEGPALPAARAWSSQHGNDGVRRVSDEAVMMTGDGNLIELQATVRYRISNPRVYLFETADAPSVLRSAAESVLRDLVSGETFAALLTSDRARFGDEVLKRLRQRCDEYGPRGLGVTLDGVALHDLHPPQEVVPAYHDVTRAMEKRDRSVNEARADALRQERKQEAESLKTVRDAEAEKYAKIAAAQAQHDAFMARYQARTQLSLKQEGRLLLGALELSLQDRSPEEVERAYLQSRDEALKQQAALTDFRLYWEMLAAALSGREKVIVDADKVPGRRHLFLVPLEPFRMMFPAMPPRGVEPGTGP
jgi:Cu+-exporting ATPase